MASESPARTEEPAIERILVIVPAFNEEEAIGDVLKELAGRVPEYDVLVVDDGSTDRTAEVARAAGVRVASLPYNLGIGGALRTGFLFAVRNDYERALQFDADGQHDAAEIERLIEAADGGADLVIGSRFASDETTYEVGRVRSAAMRVLRLSVSFASGQGISDTSSGFRAFSRPMLTFFARNYPVEYMDSVEALLLACHAGFRVVETPVIMHKRASGTPSSRRIRLIYHYVRLLIVLVTTASLRGRRREA
ncbi:MAG: glycosyltransferase family 2 protein [Actinomycetota bacterium]|nr:glycosyltransferase family 2 protein [Actinomycetota bacterium]